MGVIIETGQILILNYLFLNIIWIHTVQGKKSPCLVDDPKVITLENGDEAAYVRDICVELGRKLHKKLDLKVATDACSNLANTRTSAGWLIRMYNKIRGKRENHKDDNDKVKNRALAMLEDFQNNVSSGHKIKDIEDQKLIWECINTTVILLTNLGETHWSSNLICEVKKLKRTFCEDYYNQLYPKYDPLKDPWSLEMYRTKYKQQVPDIEIPTDFKEGDEENGLLHLHECIFLDDLKTFQQHIDKGYGVSRRDKHGNTPLHLAVMLGKTEFIKILLERNAIIRLKNLAGWNSLNEAISYGDEFIILQILKTYNKQFHKDVVVRRKKLLPELKRIPDFQMDLNWDFHSWIPGADIFLPSDFSRIQKRGSSVRLDTAFMDFENLAWKPGHLSLLLIGDAEPNPILIYMDNVAQNYIRMEYRQEFERVKKSMARKLVKEDIVSETMSKGSVTFSRAKSGLFFKSDKRTEIGPFDVYFYNINGLELRTRKRREHLDEPKVKVAQGVVYDRLDYQKEVFRGFKEYKSADEIELDMRFDSRSDEVEILPPPPVNTVTWKTYISSEPEMYTSIGRPVVLTEEFTRIPDTTTIGICRKFPIAVESFVKILEVIAPFKHFNRLREFMKLNWPDPDGFPMKFEMPVRPTISARITVEEFIYSDTLSPELFEIPRKYRDITGRKDNFFL